MSTISQRRILKDWAKSQEKADSDEQTMSDAMDTVVGVVATILGVIVLVLLTTGVL